MISYGEVWSCHGYWSLKRSLFLGLVQAAGLSALETYVLSLADERRLDSATVKKLRSLSRGTSWWDPIAQHTRQLTNNQVFLCWKVLPTRPALAVRMVRWLQQMTANRAAHRQTMGAIWGYLDTFNEAPTLDANGRLRDGGLGALGTGQR